MTWHDGYVTEIPYTQGFYHHLNPSNLNMALLMKSIKPINLQQPFTYCELACGFGLTTHLLSAIYPHAEFYATDFNPTHILSARSFASAAGLHNVHFMDASFKEYLHADLPEFDFIGLHGIYSWISHENRQVIVEFIRRKLKVGGLVYVSYNAMPGWSSMSPLQRLMLKHGEHSSGYPEQRIEQVLRFIHQLQENKAVYLQNPIVHNHWTAIQNQSRSYLIHEYFNQHWTALYFDQVQSDMAQAKMQFLGSAQLMEQIDHFNLTQEAINHLATINDPTHREIIRDFYLNTQFRRDIYIKGKEIMPGHEQVEAFRQMKFMLVTNPDQIQLEHQTPLGKLQLQEQVYKPIIDLLHQRPMAVRDMELSLHSQGISLQQIIQALIVLTSLNYAHPLTPVACQASTMRFNREVLNRAIHSGEIAFLASAVIGNGVHVSRLDQIFLLAEAQNMPTFDFIWQVFQNSGLKLTKDGQTLETEMENRQFLVEQFQQFQQQRRPLLKSLGI